MHHPPLFFFFFTPFTRTVFPFPPLMLFDSHPSYLWRPLGITPNTNNSSSTIHNFTNFVAPFPPACYSSTSWNSLSSFPLFQMRVLVVNCTRPILPVSQTTIGKASLSHETGFVDIDDRLVDHCTYHPEIWLRKLSNALYSLVVINLNFWYINDAHPTSDDYTRAASFLIKHAASLFIPYKIAFFLIPSTPFNVSYVENLLTSHHFVFYPGYQLFRPSAFPGSDAYCLEWAPRLEHFISHVLHHQVVFLERLPSSPCSCPPCVKAREKKKAKKRKFKPCTQ